MKRFKKIVTSKLFGKYFFWVFMVLLVIPNVGLSITDPMSWSGRVLNVALPLALYVWLASWSRHLGRTVWCFFPVIFFAAFQVVLLGLYGRSPIGVDMLLNVVTTNPTEVNELLSNLWPYVLLVVVLYVPPLVVASLMWSEGARLSRRFVRRVRNIFCGVFFCLFVWWMVGGRPSLFPFNVLENLRMAVERTIQTNHYAETSANFSYHAVSTRPDSVPEVYLLVVGETARGNHWQINGYPRPTTPGLSATEGVVSFPKVRSESNTTHKSVPMLLSHLRAETFGDSIYRIKSIVTAFKEAGYHTTFLTTQRRNHSYIEFFANEADRAIWLRDSSEDISDLDLLGPVARAIADISHPKRLIVLHTYGSHFNYRDRYPRSMARFTPDSYPRASKAYRDNLNNAYDNTILLTDSLLTALIHSLEHLPQSTLSGLLYASDHGEDIFDDPSESRFLHASPFATAHQLNVPFMFWLSPGLRNLAVTAAGNKGKWVSSSSAFLHTALFMAGIDTPYLKAALSPMSPHYLEPTPVFLNDANRSEPITDALK